MSTQPEPHVSNVITEVTDAGVVQSETYRRIPFLVDAVQVTSENMEAVASVFAGQIESSFKNDPDGSDEKIELFFIRVDVNHPVNDRQTKAYPGDWILKSDTGLKVYTQKAFERSFEKVVTRVKHGTDYRDATTGKFVSKEYAEAHPETTVGEADYKG